MYGFNNQYNNFFQSAEQILSVIDIEDVENSTPQSRKETRIALEQEKFDEDHYMYPFIFSFLSFFLSFLSFQTL